MRTSGSAIPWLAGLAALAGSLAFVLPASAAPEVWIGGGNCWNEIHDPKNADQWDFCRHHVAGLYINNFAMRQKTEDQKAALLQKLQQTAALLTHKNVFYETDRIHDSDQLDRDAIALFKQAGLDLKGATINYGLDPQRKATLTAGGTPLYFMYGPWRVKGNLNDPSNADLRRNILQTDGASVDGPIVMWAPDKSGTRQGVISGIKFCHAHGKKFLYLLAPNDSGAKFLPESQQLLHELEDKNAMPDILAVSFYGPKSFRELLNVLPESLPDGKPAPTFAGVVYWAYHHLNDPKHWARLQVPPQADVATAGVACAWSPLQANAQLRLNLDNHSTWLDLAPRIRVRCSDPEISPEQFAWSLDGHDVSPLLQTAGLSFIRELRLQPGDRRAIGVRLNPSLPLTHPVTLQIDLYAHPSADHPNQTLEVTISPPATQAPASERPR
ncbi:MAG: hypothetical protein ACTHLZ_10100 [Tepidisphaeraceae bacterium]